MFDLRSQRQLVKAKQNDIRLLTSAWKLNPNEIHLEEKIASGAFGEVRMCVHRVTSAQRAIKIVRKSNMDKEDLKMLLKVKNFFNYCNIQIN